MLGFDAVEETTNEDLFRSNAERRAKLLVKLKNSSPAAPPNRPISPNQLDLSDIRLSPPHSPGMDSLGSPSSPRGETEEQRDVRRWYGAVARAREASESPMQSPGLSESRSPPPRILTQFTPSHHDHRFNADELDHPSCDDSDESEMVEIRAYTKEDGHVSPRLSRDVAETLTPQSSPGGTFNSSRLTFNSNDSEGSQENASEVLLPDTSESPAASRLRSSRWMRDSPSRIVDSPSQSIAARCREALQRSERSMSSRSGATSAFPSPFKSPFRSPPIRQRPNLSQSPFSSNNSLQREVDLANTTWRQYQTEHQLDALSGSPAFTADELVSIAVSELEWYQSTVDRLMKGQWQREALWRAFTTWVVFNNRQARTRWRVMHMERDMRAMTQDSQARMSF